MAYTTKSIRMDADVWERIGARAEALGLGRDKGRSAWIRMALIRQLEAEESPGRQ